MGWERELTYTNQNLNNAEVTKTCSLIHGSREILDQLHPESPRALTESLPVSDFGIGGRVGNITRVVE